MKSPDTEKLAAMIAKMLDAESRRSDIAAALKAVEKIEQRLDRLEQVVEDRNTQPYIGNTDHPSLDKFTVAEAIADSIFDGRYKEKACQLEPSKPCDHCSMCSSRGF